MKLDAYLETKAISREAFAKAVGVTPEAVRLWCLGIRTPRWKAIRAIEKQTEGKVGWQDFEPDRATA